MRQGMTNIGFLSYHDEDVEGEVYLDAEFFDLDGILQLDILGDWIHLLESIKKAVHKAEYGEH